MSDRGFALGSAWVHVWEPEGPVRALVQLQHGFGEYSERYVHEYNRLVPHLLAAGFEVWAMDLEGHGTTPGRRGSVDVPRAVHEHATLRARLVERGLPVLLFGHSLGGLLTAASVLSGSDGVRGVVLTGPAFMPPAPPVVPVAAGLVASVVPHAPIPSARARSGRRTRVRERPIPTGGDPLLYRGRVSMRVGAGVLRTSERLWRNIDRWHTPCLVVHGTADATTDHRQSARFVERLPPGDSALHLVEGGPHELLDHDTGDEVLDLVLSWLKAHGL